MTNDSFVSPSASNLTESSMSAGPNQIELIDLFLYVLYFLIFMFGVVGNSIVIYVLMSSIFLNRTSSGGTSGRRCPAMTNAHSTMTAVTVTRLAPAAAATSPISRGNNNSFRNLVKRNGNESERNVSSQTRAVSAKTSLTTAAGNYLGVDDESNRKSSSRLSSGVGEPAITINHVADRSNSIKDTSSTSFKQVHFFFTFNNFYVYFFFLELTDRCIFTSYNIYCIKNSELLK